MPKSNYYHMNLIKSDGYMIWEAIKDSLKHYTNNLHDYEEWQLEDQTGLFWDEAHLSERGANLFTNRLKYELIK